MVDKSISLEWRTQRAMKKRSEGYNCAQAVLFAFPDIFKDESMAAKVAAALGSGVAASGEICGVPNAIAILVGLSGDDSPAAKVVASKSAAPVITAFRDDNNGRLRCHDLKRPDALRPCNDLIIQGIELLHNHLNNEL